MRMLKGLKRSTIDPGRRRTGRRLMLRRYSVCTSTDEIACMLMKKVDLLRSITDPEHPVTLEQLRVVNPEDIKVAGNRVLVYLTPTIPHCSMSTLIGGYIMGWEDDDTSADHVTGYRPFPSSPPTARSTS
jgi:hypothetical protein